MTQIERYSSISSYIFVILILTEVTRDNIDQGMDDNDKFGVSSTLPWKVKFSEKGEDVSTLSGLTHNQLDQLRHNIITGVRPSSLTP